MTILITEQTCSRAKVDTPAVIFLEYVMAPGPPMQHENPPRPPLSKGGTRCSSSPPLEKGDKGGLSEADC